MADSISWLATAATVLAALVTASNLGARITGYGFVIFLVGSLSWLTVGALTGQPALLWTNSALTLLNIWGIWRWLGRQAVLEKGGEAAQQASAGTPGEALFPSSWLARSRVKDCRGRDMGSGIDAMIGCTSGRIDYLLVSAGGVGGVGERLHRVSWDCARVEGEEIRLSISENQFGSLPEVPRDQWPAR